MKYTKIMTCIMSAQIGRTNSIKSTCIGVAIRQQCNNVSERARAPAFLKCYSNFANTKYFNWVISINLSHSHRLPNLLPRFFFCSHSFFPFHLWIFFYSKNTESFSTEPQTTEFQFQRANANDFSANI